MRAPSGLRGLLAAVVLGLAVVAAAVGAGRAVGTGARLLERAQERRHESWSEARIRLFGAPWVEGFEVIRERVPEAATVYFVDFQAEERPQAEYFALHELAPRRVVRFGTHRERSMRWLTRHIPPDAEWVALIEGLDEAPVVERYGEFRSRGSVAP